VQAQADFDAFVKWLETHWLLAASMSGVYYKRLLIFNIEGSNYPRK
jgi:hypothetical protein